MTDELKQTHEILLKELLVAGGCTNLRGETVRWTQDVLSAFRQAGHSSLDFDHCSCNPHSHPQARKD